MTDTSNLPIAELRPVEAALSDFRRRLATQIGPDHSLVRELMAIELVVGGMAKVGQSRTMLRSLASQLEQADSVAYPLCQKSCRLLIAREVA